MQLAAALVGTAPLGSLGVQHQLRRAGELEVQRELFVGVVLGVHDAQQVLAPALAQPGVDALGAALAGHPLKAVGVVFAVKQGGLGGVYQAQTGEILLESVMEGILEQVPVQLPFFVPLAEVPQLVAHEVELFARMHIHIEIEGAQLGALFGVGAPQLVDDGLFAVHHLVVAQGQ